MTHLEKRLAANLLNLAADEFSNHGCNDFDLFKFMTPEEALDLQRAMHAWNGDPEEAPATPQEARWGQDSFLMRYFAAKLQKEGS
jgi:hypothetical protein